MELWFLFFALLIFVSSLLPFCNGKFCLLFLTRKYEKDYSPTVHIEMMMFLKEFIRFFLCGRNEKLFCDFHGFKSEALTVSVLTLNLNFIVMTTEPMGWKFYGDLIRESFFFPSSLCTHSHRKISIACLHQCMFRKL